jgi:hypothetical protein
LSPEVLARQRGWEVVWKDWESPSEQVWYFVDPAKRVSPLPLFALPVEGAIPDKDWVGAVRCEKRGGFTRYYGDQGMIDSLRGE